jgi:putative membrane protein
MDSKKVLRGVLATTAMACMMSFGMAAQDQSSSGASSTGGSQSAASSSSSGKLSAADQAFVKKAAQGGMAEVELGKLAAQKASSDDVKKFGQRMVDDHTKANDQLKSIASQKGVDVPSSLDSKDQALKDKLSGLSGEQFDRMYVMHMVQDHKKDIAEFQKEANSGKDPDVKNFASQTLPTLQDHLKNVQEVHSKMASSKGAGSGSTSANSQEPK